MQGGAGTPISTQALPVPRSGGSQHLTRDQLLELGRAGKPWSFLPIALRAAEACPQDFGLRLLIAANFARLALPTPAAEILRNLPPDVARLAEVRALLDATRLMPPDVIPAASRIAQCRANLAALGDRGPGLGPELEDWADRAGQVECCRASDGNVIRRARLQDGSYGPWQLVADHRATAADWDARIAADSRACERAIILEGADPPWLLARLLHRRTDRKDSYRPRLTLVQADRSEFFDGLSLAELTPGLGSPHVVAFTGPGAAESLRADLRARIDFDIAGPVLSLLSVRTRLDPPTVDISTQVAREQQLLTESLHARVQELYRGRGPGDWARRYQEALAGTGDPLRVLIPTARNSTFVKHASADLVDAFNRLGMRAELLIEPDDGTRMAAPAYLRRFAELRPDLVILINYPRSMMADAIPADVPFVCWLQDAMPHLFRAEAGAAHGPLDFLAGHLFQELFSKHGYPRQRALESHVLASDAKFHATPIHDRERARLECEIAYVSHQSETPDAQHDRLRAGLESAVAGGRAVDRLREIIHLVAARHPSRLRSVSHHHIHGALRAGLRREPDARLTDLFTRTYVDPYADRLMRHETLRWAAEVCRRKGWRFRIYGRGWETHPHLAEFAAGELPHGDGLRASYQAARAHLHMTIHSLVHPRVFECLLSGGFPLCRMHASELNELILWHAGRSLREGVQPLIGARGPRYPTLPWGASAAMMSLAAALQRLGVMDSLRLSVDDPVPGLVIRRGDYDPADKYFRPEREKFCAYWNLGEQAEFFFHDPATLEQRMTDLIERPGLRAAVARVARSRTAESGTCTSLARRIAEFIRDGLAQAAGSESPSPDRPGFPRNGALPTRTGDRKDAA